MVGTCQLHAVEQCSVACRRVVLVLFTNVKTTLIDMNIAFLSVIPSNFSSVFPIHNFLPICIKIPKTERVCSTNWQHWQACMVCWWGTSCVTGCGRHTSSRSSLEASVRPALWLTAEDDSLWYVHFIWGMVLSLCM